MGAETMGPVLTEAMIGNLEGLWAVERQLLPPEEVRRITVSDALFDTRVTLLSLPTRLIRQLGLSPHRRRRVICRAGITEATIYNAVRLTIQERDCTVEVMEVPDEVPVLIGQLPSENLDLVVDLRGRCLTGNPAHGGEQVFEMY
jgi:predicted aspartyl protease